MGDREKRKAQEKNEKILLELSKDPKNSFCADCNLKGPRWASTNLGVFLCMPCAGLHRKMGTHISKVKSLTLDTWTEEQLNHFMQWGNEKANALYNPHPENHPVPVGESDMEQYIRDKYERKRFQEGRSKPTAPPRDNSRQGNSGTYESVAALNTLREMGWTDEQKNRDILKQAKGDVNAAIEILCTLPLSSNHQRRPSADPRMQQLQSMGFTDQAKNNAVLQQCNGSVERAIEVLVAERRKTQAPPAQSDLFANSTFESAPAQSGQQGFLLAPPGKQNAPSQQQNRQTQPQSNSQANAPAPSGLDLLGDVFGGQDPFMANKKQEDAFGAGATQQPNKSNKDSIMSLFGSAQPAPAMGMGGAGFGNPMMMGGGGFSPQQLQQQQQQQAAMQNFMGNGMMGANAGFMQQHQPYQQQMNPFQSQKQQNNMYGNGQMQGAGGFNPSAAQLGGGFAGMQHPNMQQQNYLAVSNQESSSNPFGSPNLMHGNSVYNQNAAQVPRQITAPFGSTMSSGLQPQQQQQQSNPNNAAFASLNPFAATGSSGVKKNANPFA